MTAPVGHLLAVLRVLDGLWSIGALTITLGSDTLYPDRESSGVGVLVLDVHADDFAGAERIAARAGLEPAAQSVHALSYSLPVQLRRDWSGWICDDPRMVPYSVRVTAFEPLADHPTPTGPGARDGWESVSLFGAGSDTDEHTDGIADESASSGDGVKAAA
ncbi:hypothetical protein ACIG47_16845 [Promicromonospora sp. NPDC052451]|uniref:hypothetical protein n=1 Tax=Promicromonospora sp. NPDC052451 TaxID=3364407 RepID=UPI0037C87A58